MLFVDDSVESDADEGIDPGKVSVISIVEGSGSVAVNMPLGFDCGLDRVIAPVRVFVTVRTPELDAFVVASTLEVVSSAGADELRASSGITLLCDAKGAEDANKETVPVPVVLIKSGEDSDGRIG